MPGDRPARSSNRNPPALALPIGLAVGQFALPLKALHRLRDAILLRPAYARRFDKKCLLRHLTHGDPRAKPEVCPDRLLPNIRLVTGGLLRLDELALEVLVGPPLRPGAILGDGLCEQLVAVSNESIDVD